MYQPWIFAAAVVSGSALIAFSVTQANPIGPEPSLEPSPDAVRVVPPDAPTWVPEPPVTSIDLPALVITARSLTARKREAIEPRLRPCSGWRAIGPAYVDSAGNPTGERRVRELCE
jgi:hypothetical protein